MAQKLYEMSHRRHPDYEAAQKAFNEQQMMPRQGQQGQPNKED
jgi:hypothetical protein